MRTLRGIILALAFLLLLLTPPGLTTSIAALRQADLLVEQKEYARALKTYTSLFELIDPSILHTRIGNVYLQKRQLDDARAHFQQALALDAKDANALLGLGLVALQRNKYEEAIDALQQAQAADSGEPEIDYQLGIAYLESFDFERARTAFGRVINAKDSDGRWKAKAYYKLGLAYLPQDISIARSYFALVENDSHVEGLASTHSESSEVSGLAPIRVDLSDVSGLARLMQREIGELGMTPNNEAYVAARLGHALLQADEERLARYYLEKAVKLQPDYAEAKAYLGYAYWVEGRQQEALGMLRDAIALDPSQPVGHLLLGIALREPRYGGSNRSDRDRQQQLSESIDEFRQAIRLDKGNADAYVELGNTLVLQARYTDARDAFEKAMSLRPNDVQLKLAAIWFHLDHLFEVDRGLEIARDAAQIAPTNAEVKDALGWALYANGQIHEAEEVLREAINGAPFSAKAHYHLAVLLERRGDKKGAEAEYRRAIDLDIEGDIARRAEDAVRAMRGN